MRERDLFPRPHDEDGRDWAGEAKDEDDVRRPSIRRLRRLTMAMRMELRQQDEEKSDG